jgi:hypothetical protein
LWHETPFHIKEAFVETRFGIGEGPEERPLCGPKQPGWYLPLRKIPLAENVFLQAVKRAENTKEKSRRCLTL